MGDAASRADGIAALPGDELVRQTGASKMKPLASLKTRFVVWVWNHTPTCAEMSRLTSRALGQPLTIRMRLKMRLHFVICAWCRRYFEQINFLHHQAPRLESEPGKRSGRGLSAESKRRMLERIKSGQ